MKKIRCASVFLALCMLLCTFPAFSLSAGAVEAGPTGETDKDRLYILLYDHSDYHAGEYPIDYIFEHYFDQYSALMEEYPDLVLGNQYGGSFYDYLEENAEYKTYADKLKNYITGNDRVNVIGGTYSQAISFWLPEESAIRQFTYGIRGIEDFTGKKVNYFAYSENTGFSYLPQILNDFGIKGAITRTHYAPLGHTPTIDGSMVNWVGIDGSKIKAIPTYNGDNLRTDYAGMHLSEATFIDWLKWTGLPQQPTRLDEINKYYSDKKKQGIEYVVLTVIEDTIFSETKPLLDQIKAADPEGKKYIFTTAEEVFDIIDGKVELQDFAPKPNDWSISMNTGYYGDKAIRKTTETARLITDTEALYSFLKLSNPAAAAEDITEQIDKAYQEQLRAEAHGMYEVPEIMGNHLQQLLSAEGYVLPIQEQSLTELNKNINNPYDGDSLVIYNTQNYDRKELVTQQITIPKGKRLTAIEDASAGENVPFEVSNIVEKSATLQLTVSFVSDIKGYSHKVYHIEVGDGEQVVTMTEKADAQNGATVKGNGYTLTIGANGEISSLVTDSGQKIISTVNGNGGLYFTGNFYSITDNTYGSMQRSSAKLAGVYEGDVSTRIIAEGSISDQPIYTIITVYKDLPYSDIKIIANIEQGVGIGTVPAAQHEAWGEGNTNSRQKKLNVNFKPDFQLGGAFAEDTLTSQYKLYDYEAYNKAVNVSRYTPYYPEQYQRASELTMLTSEPTQNTNHVYDILSKYYIDVSDTDGSRGLSIMLKGGAGLTYDGNTLSLVMGQSTSYNQIANSSMSQKFTINGKEYAGNNYWEYRILPHDEKSSTTDIAAGGEQLDLLKLGMSYNAPLIVSETTKTEGALPAEYQYLTANIGDSVIVSNLTTTTNGVFARTFEYKGKDGGEVSFAQAGKAVELKPYAMSMEAEKADGNTKITPYKIGTYQMTVTDQDAPGAESGFHIPMWGYIAAGGVLLLIIVAVIVVVVLKKKKAKA